MKLTAACSSRYPTVYWLFFGRSDPATSANFCWDVTVRSAFEVGAQVVASPAQPSADVATVGLEVTLREG